MIFEHNHKNNIRMDIELIGPECISTTRIAMSKIFCKKDVSQIEDILKNKAQDSASYMRHAYMLIGERLNGVESKTIISQLKGDLNIGWNHPVFYSVTCRIKEQDDFIIKPFEVEEGVIECRCGSKRVFSYSKQSRSADEPMSTYAQCMVCKSKWVYSG